MNNLKFEKEKRLITAQQKRQGISEQTYEEINWSDLFENNLLDEQTVATLDKYIDHHKLGAYQYKTEKVQAIKLHIATTIVLGMMMILSSQHVIVPHLSPVMVVMRTFPLGHRTLLVKVNMYLQPHLEGGQLKDQINLKTSICKRLFQGT